MGVVLGEFSGKKYMLIMESAAEIPVNNNGVGTSAAMLECLMRFDRRAENVQQVGEGTGFMHLKCHLACLCDGSSPIYRNICNTFATRGVII